MADTIQEIGMLGEKVGCTKIAEKGVYFFTNGEKIQRLQTHNFSDRATTCLASNLMQLKSKKI